MNIKRENAGHSQGDYKPKRWEEPEYRTDNQYIDDDDYNYIREIIRNMKSNEDDESQTIMADNFLEACQGKEVEFSTNPSASQAVEKLTAHCSPEIFEKFTTALMPSLRLMVNDNCASFVLESCLKVAALRAVQIKVESSDEVPEEPATKKKKFSKVSSVVDFNLKLEIKHAHKVYCQQFVEKLSRFLLNNIEDYLKENNANHLIRSCLLCMSGVIGQKNHFHKVEHINLKQKFGVTIPDNWSETVAEFATRLMSWPQFPDLAFDESSSVVLQTLCQAMKNVENQTETLKTLVRTIMQKSFKDETETEDPEEFKAFSSVGSTHLLESMMDACEEKQLNKIYKKYFKAKFLELCDSQKLNFAVQRLIDAMKDKVTFEEIFNTLSPEFENLLKNGRTGVVFAVCKGCERLGVKQGQFIQSLQKSLDCGGEKTSKCIFPIVTLTPLRIIEEKGTPEICLHGSLILQHIFQFNKPIKIIQSLLEMKAQDVANIFCDQKGSRIADAYLESKFIGEKSREKLIKHLEGMYSKMAQSKSGSHVLEKFYKLSSDTQKEVIVKELSERVNQLNGSVSGRIINYKFSVEAYARNVNQWRSFLARSATR